MPETLCGFSFLQCTTLLLFFASAEVNRGGNCDFSTKQIYWSRRGPADKRMNQCTIQGQMSNVDSLFFYNSTLCCRNASKIRGARDAPSGCKTSSYTTRYSIKRTPPRPLHSILLPRTDKGRPTSLLLYHAATLFVLLPTFYDPVRKSTCSGGTWTFRKLHK